jgi:hypothetical protein
MIGKLSDAGSMLWQTLERRERLLVLGLLLLGFAVVSAASQARREDALAEKIARRLGA